MKKKTKIFLAIIITLIVLLGLFKWIEERSIIYCSTHSNYSWGHYRSEDRIYSTGKISWYSKSSDGEVKKGFAHLTSEELATLKELAKNAKQQMKREERDDI